MKFEGCIHKMRVDFDGKKVEYFLNLDDLLIMNGLLKREIKISFEYYQCLNCGEDKEIFAMGFCKNCFFKTPAAGDWVLRPELSKAQLGIEDRDLDFEKEMQLQPHIIYLANSGGLKVGVTRKSNMYTRWIDQGAEYAIKLAETENRYEAGLIEVSLKDHFNDKTNFRKMLTENVPLIDLVKEKGQLNESIPKELQHFITDDNTITSIYYPIIAYPSKIKAINLKKVKEVKGKLMGIKGQYLIFNNNLVLNVRNHEGFVVSVDVLSD